MGRHFPRPGQLLAHDRTVTRKTVAVVREQFRIAAQRRPSAQGLDGGGIVVPHGVVQATHDGQLVHHLGAARQVLANAYSRHSGRDGVKLATHFTWGIGLHIPGVKLTGTAIVIDQNAMPQRRGKRRRRCSVASSRLGLKEPGKV